MKTLKSITKAILIVIALLSFVMMTAEAQTMEMQFVCTTGAAATLLLSTRLLDKLGVFDEED